MSTNQRASSEAGITLLELTMAIGILAVIILLNYSILSGVVKAKAVIDDKREAMFIANSVLTRLAREIQMASDDRALLPSCGTLAPSNQQQQQSPQQGNSAPPIVLVGEPGKAAGELPNDTLTFLAKEGGQYIPDGGTHSGIVQITYRVEPDPDNKEVDTAGRKTFLLVRDEMPYQRPNEKACRNAIRFPITKDLISLTFRYYDNKTKEWSDTWNENKSVRLPSMIHYTLILRTPAGALETYSSIVGLRTDK